MVIIGHHWTEWRTVCKDNRNNLSNLYDERNALSYQFIKYT